MKKYIYPKDGNSPPEVVEAEPMCGIDYCDRCGDCLDCYQDGLCTDDSGHFWVVYEESESEDKP